MAKARKYYTLLVMYSEEKPYRYCIEAGSYDMHEMQEEKQEYASKGHGVKIIRTSDKQADIDAEVSRLNANM